MTDKKLTKQAIDNLQAGDNDAYLWDTSPRGFGVRARPRGAKTFIFAYRTGGGRSANRQRYTIGKYGTLTLDQARKEAVCLAGLVASGRDPLAEKLAKRREKQRDELTVATIAEEFIEKYVKPKNKSWWEYQRILDRYVLPTLGNSSIYKVSRSEVAVLLEAIAANNGRVMSDHVLAVIRKLFNWQQARDENFRTPIVRGMAKTSSRERARSRILSPDEIRAIFSALDAEPYPFGPLVKFLFYTAQRRSEAANAQWDHFQGDDWVIPVEHYKGKKPHVVPLSPQALKVLREVPRSERLVFTTTGLSPFSGFSKAKKRLDEASGVSGWTLHDIRRTGRSLLAQVQVRPDIAERVLGHAIPGVAGVYDQYAYHPEKKDALERLGQEIDRIVGTTDANVIKIAA